MECNTITFLHIAQCLIRTKTMDFNEIPFCYRRRKHAWNRDQPCERNFQEYKPKVQFIGLYKLMIWRDLNGWSFQELYRWISSVLPYHHSVYNIMSMVPASKWRLNLICIHSLCTKRMKTLIIYKNTTWKWDQTQFPEFSLI